MIQRFFTAILLILLMAPAVHAADPDYLSLMAEESEIKAIAEVSSLRRVSQNSDGTFMHVTFKLLYSITPYTAKSFVGGCKVMESNWQKRAPGTIYFNPRKGQKVYVTITYDGGAITSYTLLNRQLETVLKEEPYRITYSKGKALVLPEDN